ncbi:MAG: serine/threonine protein kinase [Candidatus Solibacter sp.]|nr:serine/threonine protein kinase [Candidatus Solibacter sp.]
MMPDRWKLIEELYHSARERGVGVLADTDPEVRREVERLLAQDSDGRILDRPAAELLDEFTATEWAPGGGANFAGQTVSHYSIQEEIGAGGMGVVYKALDTKLGRVVALKFLPPRLSHDKELKRRLSEEARAASALDHPNIVVIHDIDETPGGDVFIAMAFHEGVTLREKIASGLPVAEALRIARQIASGLAKAHEHGIFHRDIKPGNVIVAKDGIARIIDFGLAKSNDGTVTLDGVARGTPLYMSPEQACGAAVDWRTDLWSLGAVIYEMLSGEPPFRGDGALQVMHAVVHDPPPKLREVRPEIEAIVLRALQKDPPKRYQSAAEMVNDLSAALAVLDAPPERSALRAVYAIPAAVLVLLAAGLSIWLYQRSEKRHWAREQAIPEIGRLTNHNRPLAALRLWQEAERYLPGDPQLAQIAEGLAHTVSVRSSPPGATVGIKDYLSPDEAWAPLGTTPLEHVKIPNGYLRWRVAKQGVAEYVGAPIAADIHGFVREYNFALDAAAAAPEGMTVVPAGQAYSLVWSLGDLGPYNLPAFYMDRFEVTNRQYQEFVDKGGYQKREYWKEKFVRDGKELSWEQATEGLRDSTGRPGPATWAAGHYPEVQADYPVGGVSWYEASAYAEFAGKSLPAIAQWYLAAPSAVAKYITPVSNFSNSMAPAGKYQGVGPLGTYDMAGNVAEWCRNESGGGARYLLGGGSNTPPTEYFEPAGVPPFHRGANAGFRCVRNSAPLPAEVVAERRQTIRDLAHAKPAEDSVYRIYRSMYSYDRTPLNAKVESVAQDSKDWRKEKITFDAAYGNERMTAYLFVPAKVRPPYQTVLFFPSARVLDIANSDSLGDMQFIDFVIQSGRAVIYPVYKGTYERRAPVAGPDTAEGRATLIQDSKDIGRSIDYLETRADIDAKRIAYMGVSFGAALAVNFTAVEERFKSVIMLDGGFYNEKQLPGTDQVDFAPHVKAPTLLICGKFDWIFMGKDALLRLLGAPAADKKAVMFDTAHDVSEQRGDLVREVLAWLDRTLGKVK